MNVKKNLSGILLIASVIIWLICAFLVWSGGEMVKAYYVHLTLFQTVIVVTLAGIYLIDAFGDKDSKLFRFITIGSGIFISVFALLVCFNIVSFLSSWNWLVAFTILYIAFVQIQLMRWGQRVHQITRFSALFVLLSDLFLVIFFITKSHHAELRFWINLAVMLSIVFTFIGMYFLRKKVA